MRRPLPTTRRARILPFAAAVVLLAVPIAALAAVKEGDWKGKIKDEKGSKVTFEVKSAKKAVDFKATPVVVLCGVFPTSHIETRTVIVPKVKIDGKDLAGQKNYREGGELIGYVGMQGELTKKSKAKGKVFYEDASCSGEEKWSAKAK